MSQVPSEKSRKRVEKLIASYTKKSGTTTSPDEETTEAVAAGLAVHLDNLGRPLCPCRFYPDKQEEVKHRTWICPCDDMQVYKYCHCLLFVTPEGKPVTEYLPEDHVGREIWGEIADPTPDLGRPMRGKAEEREEERRTRNS